MQILQTGDGERIRLSGREISILRLAAAGLTNKEIADQLSLTGGTVRTYLSLLFGALGFTSRTEAALWVICHPEVLSGFAVPRDPRVPPCLTPAA